MKKFLYILLCAITPCMYGQLCSVQTCASDEQSDELTLQDTNTVNPIVTQLQQYIAFIRVHIEQELWTHYSQELEYIQNNYLQNHMQAGEKIKELLKLVYGALDQDGLQQFLEQSLHIPSSHSSQLAQLCTHIIMTDIYVFLCGIHGLVNQ
ncbi:hypothetical protein KG892_04770 [Vermiphilus pyriformis]|nr:MAG: hypothetical protein KG892_04770 [Vermiphilus pyriformis]